MKEKDSPKDENQKRLIADLLKTRLQIESEKQKFINSLSDILSTEQIARLLIFEKRFKEEIRSVLFDRRSPNKK